MASLELDDSLAIPPNDAGTKKDVLITAIEKDSANSSTLNSTDDSESDFYYPHPTDFKLTEKPIDEIRELKVAIIGAGLSGITAGILLPAKVPGICLTIFDKNSDVVCFPFARDFRYMLMNFQSGTWFENRYPGVRYVIRWYASLSLLKETLQM